MESLHYNLPKIKDNLLLHLDNNVTDSIGGHTVTNNNVTFDGTTKKLGTHSAVFNGTTGNLTIPNSVDFNFGNGDFTIDFWFYTTNVTGYKTLIEKRETFTFTSFSVNTTNNSILFSATSTGVSWDINLSYTGIVINTWYHVAITRTGNVFRLFVDGVLRSSQTTSVTILDSTDRVFVGGIVSTYFLAGYIDEIRINKGTALYTGDFTPPTTPYTGLNDSLNIGLASEYLFDGNANDTSGNGYNGTVTNATLTLGRYGESNNAYSFNGTSAYISIGDIEMFTNDCTIRTRVKFNASGVTEIIIGKWTETIASLAWVLQKTTANKVIFGVGNGSTTSQLTSDYVFSTGIWYDIVATKNNTLLSLYVNGKQDKQLTGVVTTITNNTENIIIGRESGLTTQYFNGINDAVQIWNRTLTKAEIKALYKQTPNI